MAEQVLPDSLTSSKCSVEKKNEFRSLLSCNSCDGIFKTPVTLVCGHTFCSDCVNCRTGEECSIVCPIEQCTISFQGKYCANVVITELIRLNFGQHDITPCLPNYSENNSKNGDNDNATMQTRSAHGLSNACRDELECKLCFNLMYKPVTTPCGHAFCTSCLTRSLDHRSDCPCCRRSLVKYLEFVTKGLVKTCQVLETLSRTMFHLEYNAREIAQNCQDITDVRSADNVAEIPIFVCTLALPDVPCPLHIFEPRYKLMIRRCMEGDSKQFGMCFPDEKHGFASYGTVLQIQNVRYLPDGRSIIDTVGDKRFKILTRDTRDGYNMATVEWLVDEQAESVEQMSDVYDLAIEWYSNLARVDQLCIKHALGQIPDRDETTPINGYKWLWWFLAALPLTTEERSLFLQTTSQAERFQRAKTFLLLLQNSNV